MKKILLVAILALSGFATDVDGQSLKGSHASVQRMERERLEHDYSIFESSSMVRRFTDAGLLSKLKGSKTYLLDGVTFPYVRPEVKLFIERLSRQYMTACGRPLVITGGTRTIGLNSSLGNASDFSVHLAGMAVDIRVSPKRACREFLAGVLTNLEGRKVLEATRESYPPHFHVAVFPEYKNYVARITRQKGRVAKK